MRMQNKDLAKAIHQTSKTPESWLQTYLQSVAQESTLTSASLLQDLKGFSDCQDTRKCLDENLQFVTSPGFLKEHAKPSAVMRKCAKDLIQARCLIDYNTGEGVHDLKDEDPGKLLRNG